MHTPILRRPAVPKGALSPAPAPPPSGQSRTRLPGTLPARAPGTPGLAGAALPGRDAVAQTLQPHRVLPGYHLLQLFGDSQQLLFLAHGDPRRPAGRGAQGQQPGLGEGGAEAEGEQPARDASTHDTHVWRGRGPSAPACLRRGGGVACTKYRFQGLARAKIARAGQSGLSSRTRLREGSSPQAFPGVACGG